MSAARGRRCRVWPTRPGDRRHPAPTPKRPATARRTARGARRTGGHDRSWSGRVSSASPVARRALTGPRSRTCGPGVRCRRAGRWRGRTCWSRRGRHRRGRHRARAAPGRRPGGGRCRRSGGRLLALLIALVPATALSLAVATGTGPPAASGRAGPRTGSPGAARRRGAARGAGGGRGGGRGGQRAGRGPGPVRGRQRELPAVRVARAADPADRDQRVRRVAGRRGREPAESAERAGGRMLGEAARLDRLVADLLGPGPAGGAGLAHRPRRSSTWWRWAGRPATVWARRCAAVGVLFAYRAAGGPVPVRTDPGPGPAGRWTGCWRTPCG